MNPMDAARFEEMVADALDAVPSEFQPHLDTVQVTVAAIPNQAQRDDLHLRPRDTLFGLYEGVPLPERLMGHDNGALPSVITLFSEPLSTHYPEPETLRREVRRTVFHELAHHFGIGDDALRAWDVY